MIPSIEPGTGLPAVRSRCRTGCRLALAALGCFAAGRAWAVPSLVGPGTTCLSCHTGTPASGGLSFLQVNGAAAAGPPWGLTVTAGDSFSFVFRSTGLYTIPSYPDTGGAVIPPDTVQWVVSQGPTWSDNGQTGSTPWTAPNTLFYRTNFPPADNSFGEQGLTANNGSASPPVDKNLLASNEVMSANVATGPSLAPGTYALTVAAMGHDASGPVSWTQPFTVYVVAPSPSPSPTFFPSLTPTPTDTPAPPGSSPTDSPTPSATATPSPSAGPSRSPTPAGAVTGLSFPDVDRLAVLPNPASAGRAKADFHLLAHAADVRLRIYTPNLALAREQDLGPCPGGWNLAPVQLQGLPPQVYYLTVGVRQSGEEHRSKAILFYVMP
jgi:hypothetical protein